MRKDVPTPKAVEICTLCQGTGKVEVLSMETGQKVWHDCLCRRKVLHTKAHDLVRYVDCG